MNYFVMKRKQEIKKVERTEIHINASYVKSIVIQNLVDQGLISECQRDKLWIMGGNDKDGWTDVKEIKIIYQK